MVIDTSAIIAILNQEPGYQRLRDAIVDLDVSGSDSLKISAVTVLELGIVLTRMGYQRHVFDVIADLGATIVSFDAKQTRIAASAAQKFGRGSGSPAKLNFGDCASYALAVHLGEPLLFVGDDFSQTDVAQPGSPA